MARGLSSGILIPVSLQRCSEESAIVEHPRIIYINMSATAAAHRTCLQWQWDRTDKLTSPPSPEMMGRHAGGSLCAVVLVVPIARSSQ